MKSVRFLFIYKTTNNRQKCPKYTFCFLFDDNTIVLKNYVLRIDKLIDNHGLFLMNRMHQIRLILEKHKLSSKSEVILTTTDRNDNHDLIYEILRFHAFGVGYRINRIDMRIVLNQISRYYMKRKRLKTNSSHGSFVTFAKKLYEALLNSRECPWINNVFDLETSNRGKENQFNQRFAAMGAYYMCIKNWSRSMNEKNGTVWKYRSDKQLANKMGQILKREEI